MVETVKWKVQGMSCSNCALTIGNYLKQKGLQNIKVSFIGGAVSFDAHDNISRPAIIEGIESLGYQVNSGASSDMPKSKKFLHTHLQRFLFCLIFTVPLLLHMVNRWLPVHFLMDPWVQLILCLPVYLTGMNYFGRSAWQSIRNKMANMNVLVATGATAAFVYSLSGSLLHLGPSYLFYETTAAIITFVFLGNYIEDITLQSTQRAINSLTKSQKVIANMIAFDDHHQEQVFPVDNSQLQSGDLILIRSGEQVPADCKILWGDACVNESILTGESLPVQKHAKDHLIGGSLLADGTVKAQVTASADNSALSKIIGLVQQAQGEKPPIQLFADRLSAVFVPVVLIISGIVWAGNYWYLHAVTPSLMRAIAVLVIACPCAMGLATPAAIAVGLGRGARKGIVFRHAKTLELFKNIRQVVFDKTGTLTTGAFTITDFRILPTETPIEEENFKRIVFSLEKYSNHPIAKCITKSWQTSNDVRWKAIQEIKGVGMKAEDKQGNVFIVGSFQVAAALTKEKEHNVYVLKNGVLLGWIDVQDELRAEAQEVVRYFTSNQIRTILLSGDRREKCEAIARELGIDEVIAEQSPADKLNKIEQLDRQSPTAMIGDGINDAPALAKATIGVSMSDATHIAVQTSDVILMNNGISHFPLALGLGKHTFITIQQNLYWALFYNAMAIPVAGLGFLSPPLAALLMGLSDIVLAANSIRLSRKKII